MFFLKRLPYPCAQCAQAHINNNLFIYSLSDYHGSLQSLIDICPILYKKLAHGKKDFVHVIPSLPPRRTSGDDDDRTKNDKSYLRLQWLQNKHILLFSYMLLILLMVLCIN